MRIGASKRVASFCTLMKSLKIDLVTIKLKSFVMISHLEVFELETCDLDDLGDVHFWSVQISQEGGVIHESNVDL